MDAVSDERLSDVTRSVSLLALWSPTAASGCAPDDITDEEPPLALCTDRLQRFSGPSVYGRVCGVRRRTANKCSRALPLADDEEDGEEEEEEEAVVAVAIVTADGGGENEGSERRGGEEKSWRW